MVFFCGSIDFENCGERENDFWDGDVNGEKGRGLCSKSVVA